MIVVNYLRRIGSNPITYDITFPLINNTLLLDYQLNYFQDIFFKKHREPRDGEEVGETGCTLHMQPYLLRF